MAINPTGIDFRTRLLGAAKLAKEAAEGKVSLTELGDAGKVAGDRAALGSRGWSTWSRQTSKSEKDAKRAKASFGGLISTLGGLGAAWAGYSGAKSAIETTGSLADETLKLSRSTGMSVKSASQWVAVARVHDIAGTGLARTFGMLSKNIALAEKQETSHAQSMARHKSATEISLAGVGYGKGYEIRRQQVIARSQLAAQAAQAKGAGEQSAAFAKLGITTKDLKKSNTDLGPIMVKLGIAFDKMHGGATRNAIANKLFGRSYNQILPLFREGNESLATNLMWAKKYGVAMGGETPKELKKYLVAQDEAKYATLGVQVAFGRFLAPALIKVMKAWPELVTEVRKGKGPFGTAASIIGTVAGGAKSVVTWFGKSKTATGLLIGALGFLGAAWGVEKIVKFTEALKKLWLVQKLIAGTSWLTGADEAGQVAAAMGMGKTAELTMVGGRLGTLFGKAFSLAAAGFIGYELGKLVSSKFPNGIFGKPEPSKKHAEGVIAGQNRGTYLRKGLDGKYEVAPNRGFGHTSAGGKAAPHGATVTVFDRALNRNVKVRPGETLPGPGAGGALARVGAHDRALGRGESDGQPAVQKRARSEGWERPIKVIVQSILKGKVVSESVIDDLLGEQARS
jgi:hypothetical protein